MQLKIETLEELHSEDETRQIDKILSRYSSLDSLDHDAYMSDDARSEDLDRLSVCLSEASSESNEGKRGSIFYEVIQAQLALWTLIGSIFYSYAWQQHRKKFLLSLFIVVPPVIIFCLLISWLLTTIVILGRIFSTPLRFEDILSFGTEEQQPTGEQKSRRHWRTLSMNSNHSSVSTYSLYEDPAIDSLPKPMCRKHSTSNGSLNQLSFRPTSPNYHNGTNGKSPTFHRLSYQFSHRCGGENEVRDQ